jgi:BirA family biotin operon repressor/biotin-[acetyl-CoA-carboxylase] ligase
MTVSRELARQGEPHGTVIAASYQKNGRGRIKDRVWQMESEKGLPFSILLRYQSIEKIPVAITLRIGLAVSAAIEDFVPELKGKVKVKWPNDIIIDLKKTSGILCEADGGIVHAGIGVNISQKIFTGDLEKKATSLTLCTGMDYNPEQHLLLLEKILKQIYMELETEAGKNWKDRLNERLYKINEQITFIEGAVDSCKEVHGILTGIGETGDLLITPNGETQSLSFITGELKV